MVSRGFRGRVERVRLLEIQGWRSHGGGDSEEMVQTPLGNCSINTHGVEKDLTLALTDYPGGISLNQNWESEMKPRKGSRNINRALKVWDGRSRRKGTSAAGFMLHSNSLDRIYSRGDLAGDCEGRRCSA
jgi:hypothetical protein